MLDLYCHTSLINHIQFSSVRRGRSRRALVRAAPAPTVAPALEANLVPQLGPGVSMLVVSATMPMVLLVPAWLVPVPPSAAPAVPAPWVR